MVYSFKFEINKEAIEYKRMNRSLLSILMIFGFGQAVY